MDGPDVRVLLITVSCKAVGEECQVFADFSTLYLHKAPGLLLAGYILND